MFWLLTCIFVFWTVSRVESAFPLTCFENGTMILDNPNATRYHHFLTRALDENKNCTGYFLSGFEQLMLENCTMSVSVEVVFMTDGLGIIRHDHYFLVSIQCFEIPPFGIILPLIFQLHASSSTTPTSAPDSATNVWNSTTSAPDSTTDVWNSTTIASTEQNVTLNTIAPSTTAGGAPISTTLPDSNATTSEK